MKVPVTLKIALLAVGATAFYAYVGQLVPQKTVEPPEVIDLPQNLTPEEMAAIGKTIFDGKGLCSTCHTLGKTGALRFPDLGGIGSRAAARIPGMGALAYLTQSMYDPNVYVVDGFNPGMPTINRPPIGLTDDEILTVIAYLQTLGGTLTVSMDTRLPIPGREGEAAEEEASAETVAATGGPLERFQCATCHYLDQPGRLKAASLQDVGTRLDRNGILASLLASHQQEAFYGQATMADLRQIVDLLASKGGE